MKQKIQTKKIRKLLYRLEKLSVDFSNEVHHPYRNYYLNDKLCDSGRSIDSAVNKIKLFLNHNK